jgi:dehydrogenase/reductase SDR family member 7B
LCCKTAGIALKLRIFENITMIQKTIWITGASDGIGAELVAAFAKRGDNFLILSARRQEKLEEIAAKNHLTAKNSLIVAFDLAVQNDYNTLIDNVLSKVEKIDVLILNAGVSQKSFAEETLESVERNIMQTNFFSNVALTKALLPSLKKTGGQIAVVSSIIAKFGAPYLSAYAASKAALNNYFESLRFEVERYHIDILIVTPGFINTKIAEKAIDGQGNAINQASKAQEKGTSPVKVAAAIQSALAKRKKHIYVGGLETFVPHFKFFFPNLFYRIWKKLHKL